MLDIHDSGQLMTFKHHGIIGESFLLIYPFAGYIARSDRVHSETDISSSDHGKCMGRVNGVDRSLLPNQQYGCNVVARQRSAPSVF